MQNPGASGASRATGYECDCSRYCKRLKPVSRSTYFSHATHRNLLSRTLATHAHNLGFIGTPPRDEEAAPNFSEPPRKKQRLASSLPPSDDFPSSSQVDNPGLAAMAFSDDPPLLVGDSDGFGQHLVRQLIFK